MTIHLLSTTIQTTEKMNLKTVEDLHEAMMTAVREIKFGMAFCEVSGPCLIRWSGTDGELIELAKAKAPAIGAGNSFLILWTRSSTDRASGNNLLKTDYVF